LERLDPVGTVHDCQLVIEEVVVLAETDALRVTVFDTLHRVHRTVERGGIEIYRVGFEPQLSPEQAASLICQEIRG
jgi:hypothetical protein